MPQLAKCKHLLFYAEKTALLDRVCLQNSLGGGGYDHLADSLFLGKIIPKIPDDAMEFTISPRASVNHGRLLP